MQPPRDKNGIAHIVPVSGGKDSTCLALALRAIEPRTLTACGVGFLIKNS
jgi:tRNA(Ile)-lysidine synthase TilS/MesJ